MEEAVDIDKNRRIMRKQDNSWYTYEIILLAAMSFACIALLYLLAR